MTEFKHDFEVGEGVHWHFNGDSYPGTVVRVTPNKVVVQHDGYRVKEGKGGFQEGAQDCEFFQNPNGSYKEFRYSPKRDRMLAFPFTLSHGREYARNPHI